MHSLTKNKQSNEVIVTMVKKALPDLGITEIKELTEGFFNVAYEITLQDTSEVILKIAPPKGSTVMTHEKNIMYTEVETMRLVKAKTSVPVPQVLYYDDSHVLCDSDFFIMTKIKGKSFQSQFENMKDEDKNAIEYKVGEYNRAMNSIIGSGFGYYGQKEKQGSDWYEVFKSIIKDAIQDSKVYDVILDIPENDIYSLLDEYKDIFKEVQTPRLVHWDLWAGNILVEDGVIQGLIDFERCLWADALMEVGFRSYSNPEFFYKGYGITELTKNEKVRAKWYDFYVFLIMTMESDYRKYEDTSISEWGKSMMIRTYEELKQEFTC
jgi:aminoglycoside phosphotransferase (APT) family kinase protein